MLHYKDIPANWMHGNNILAIWFGLYHQLLVVWIGSMIPNPELFGFGFCFDCRVYWFCWVVRLMSC